MKTICVLSYERAGTTWLCSVLNTKQTWCIFEIFSRNPVLFYWNLLTLLRLTPSIPKPIVDSFQAIFNPQNFFLDIKHHNQIKRNILALKPYCVDLIDSFKNEAYSRNKNLCFKIFPQHINEEITIEKILDISDYVIINYRSNILHTYFSWKIATQTGAWTSSDKKTPGYKESIEWNETEYLDYYKSTVDIINLWDNCSGSKNRMYLEYDEIHQNKTEEEKILFVQDQIKINLNIDISVTICEKFFKQNNYDNLSELISNYSDFQNSINNNIPISYRIH